MNRHFYNKYLLLGDDQSFMFGTYQSGRKWSECNRIDFEAHYLQNKDNWCMGDVTEGTNNIILNNILNNIFLYTS